MTLPTHTHTVIIGGGVMGASVAYHLARRGHSDVVLLEKGSFFGLGATGKCAGGIRYQFGAEINVQLSQLSLPLLDRFAAEMGQPIDRQYCGYLFLLTREEDVAVFERNVAMQNRLGVATEWLTAAEVRRRWPQLQLDDLLQATFNGRDGLADPNSVVMGYINNARRLGARCFTDAPVVGIEQEKGRVTAVVTPHGRIACEIVVNAAGPWAGPVSDLLGVPLPITPIRRQMLTTTATPDIPADFPFVIDFARSLYFHREGEGILTGMSNPDEPPGFDESVDEDWELTHMEAAIERLPLLARAGRLSGWAGLYEVTPDAYPIIGPVPQVAGYYVVGGFSGHGFMHGPAAGLLLAEMILDGQATSLDIRSLDYGRFADGRLIQEYNVI
jgi:sarcosine oxidase, subunit beta